MLLPCNDIHTFGMRAAIDVAFVASDGAVVESHRRIPPNRRLRNSRASATLERFSTDDAWFQPGDRFAMNQEEGTLLTCCQMQANA
jgi:hypothetical protein